MISCQLGLLLVAVCSAESTQFLIKDGKSEAEIVVEGDAPRTVQMAAKELKTYLQKITGAEVAISGQPNPEWPVHIYVGKSSYTKKLGIAEKPLPHGAFRLVSGDNWMAFIEDDRDFEPREPWAHSADDQARVLKEWDGITGEQFGNPFSRMWRRRDRKTGLWEFDLDNAGTFNAVNKFLRDLGVRWYAPGELGEVVPTLKSIELPRVDETVVPDFPLRNFYIYGGNFVSGDEDLILWQMRLGLNQGTGVFGCAPDTAFCHGIEPVLSREEMKREHPDFYKLEQGERQTKKGVPCLSSEELVKANVRYLRALFDHYDVKVASVMPTDGFMSLCQCEKCKGKATLERGDYGQLSDYVWDYVNRVAKEILKTHPDRKIQCAAYSSYLLPPKNIDKLPPNVVVGIATNMNKRSEFYQQAFQAWQKKLTSGIPLYQYDYYIRDVRDIQPIEGKQESPWQGVPIIFPKKIADDLRAARGKSIGEYVEISQNAFNNINTLVTAKFLWNADSNLHEFLNEYYTLFYGPAKSQMREFFEFCENNWPNMTISVSDINRAFYLIGEARLAAGESIYGKRVDQIVEAMQPLKKIREYLTTIPSSLIFKRVDSIVSVKMDPDNPKGVVVNHCYDGPLKENKHLKIGDDSFIRNFKSDNANKATEYILFLTNSSENKENAIIGKSGWTIDEGLSKRIIDGHVYLWTLNNSALNAPFPEFLIEDQRHADKNAIEREIDTALNVMERWQQIQKTDDPQLKLLLIRPFLIHEEGSSLQLDPYNLWLCTMPALNVVTQASGPESIAFLNELLNSPTFKEKYNPEPPFKNFPRRWETYGLQRRAMVEKALILNTAIEESEAQERLNILRPLFDLPAFEFFLGYDPQQILAEYMDRGLAVAEATNPTMAIPFLRKLLELPQFQDNFTMPLGFVDAPRHKGYSSEQRAKIKTAISRLTGGKQ